MLEKDEVVVEMRTRENTYLFEIPLEVFLRVVRHRGVSIRI